jgi:hypothetical protein
MGIATGQAEPQQGDYLGTVLNRAARVTATGLKTSYRTLRGHGGPSHPHDRPVGVFAVGAVVARHAARTLSSGSP